MLDQVKKTVKHSIIYSVGNAANKLVGFILLPLYTSTFSVAIYGVLALFDTISDFLLTFSSFGIIEALKRWYWDKDTKDKQKSMFFTVLLFSIVTALLFLTLSYLLLGKYSFEIFGINIAPRTIWFFLGSILTNVMLQRMLILLRIQQKAAQNMIYNIVKLVFVLGSTVYFITVLNWGMDSVFISRLIGQSIALLILLPQFIKNCKIKIEFSLLKEMLSYSWPLAISTSLGLILTLSDRWLLKGMASLDIVGNYSLAYKISNIVKLLVVQSFAQAFVYIYFKQMDNRKNYRFFSKAMTYFSFLLTILSLAIVLFSKEIIVLLAQSSDYYDSYRILPFLILSVSFAGLRQMLVLPLNKYKKTKIISLVTISAGLLNVGLNILFIPLLGGVGAAIATALAQLAVVITYLILNRKFADYRYEVVKIFSLFALGSFLAFTGMQLGGIALGPRIAIKIGILLSFPLVLRVLGFYEKIELLRIRQSWQKWRNPLRWKENFKNINLKN